MQLLIEDWMNYYPQCSTVLHQLSIFHWHQVRDKEGIKVFWGFLFQNEITSLLKNVLLSCTKTDQRKTATLDPLCPASRGMWHNSCSQKRGEKYVFLLLICHTLHTNLNALLEERINEKSLDLSGSIFFFVAVWKCLNLVLLESKKSSSSNRNIFYASVISTLYMFANYLIYCLFSRHNAASPRWGGTRSWLQLHQCWRLQDLGGEWTPTREWNLWW